MAPSCYNKASDMRKLTRARLVLAIISTPCEEVAIYAIWRWLLPVFDIHLPVQVLIGVMIAWLAFSVWLFIFTTWTLGKQVTVGLPSMVGSKGKVTGKLSPEGMVRIKGELWGATSTGGDIDTGEEVVVVSEDGLMLSVRRAGDSRTKR